MQFILYCLCGIAGFFTDYSIYSLIVIGGLWYQFANLAGYFSGTAVSFFLNRAITFRVRDKVNTRFGLFFLVACIGFLSSAFILWIAVDLLDIDPKIAKLLTLPFVVAIQFSLNQRLTFNERL